MHRSPRPDWVKPGHTFELEPDWLILPPSFRPRCDTCGLPVDHDHADHRPTATGPASTPAPPRRYWGD